MSVPVLRIPIFLLCISLAGCFTTSRFQTPTAGQSAIEPNDLTYESTIQMRYLGSGGYVLQRGPHAIVTGPFYTNPHWLQVGLGTISADTALIDRHHPPLEGIDVAAILVGHAHYDHLMDVPYIARKYHPEATVYGNQSTYNLSVASEPSLKHRTVVLQDQISRDGKPGSWVYVADSTIRFMAIASMHGPHAAHIHLMQGNVSDLPERTPRSAWGWKEGESLTYIIDFLGTDGVSVDYRIYYADSTTPSSMGLPPTFSERDANPLDMAILCVGSSAALKEYPQNFLSTNIAKTVVLGHWENFFRSPDAAVHRLRVTHIKRFADIVDEYLEEGGSWILPQPKAVYILSSDE